MTETLEIPQIEDVIAKLGTLPAMPAVVMDLVASIDDESIDMEQLTHKIERDQALTSKTLRVANSAFFGLAGKVGSIREAATIIGLRSIRSIALASALGGVMRREGDKAMLCHFWTHAFMTAVAGRQLAGRVGVSAEHAFVAGLLHDIGKLAVAYFYPDIEARLEQYCKDHAASWCEAELALGMPTHGQIGSALARRWHFPEPLCAALDDYHADCDMPLARLIYVADLLAACHAAANGERVFINEIDEHAWHAVIHDERDLQRALCVMHSAAEMAVCMV